MVTAGLMVIVLGILAIVAGQRFASRWALSVGVAILVYTGSWAVWSLLIMLHLVPIDPLLQWLHVYRLYPPWNTLLFLGPPLVPALLAAWFGGRWMAGRWFHRRSG